MRKLSPFGFDYLASSKWKKLKMFEMDIACTNIYGTLHKWWVEWISSFYQNIYHFSGKSIGMKENSEIHV